MNNKAIFLCPNIGRSNIILDKCETKNRSNTQISNPPKPIVMKIDINVSDRIDKIKGKIIDNNDNSVSSMGSFSEYIYSI